MYILHVPYFVHEQLIPWQVCANALARLNSPSLQNLQYEMLAH